MSLLPVQCGVPSAASTADSMRSGRLWKRSNPVRASMESTVAVSTLPFGSKISYCCPSGFGVIAQQGLEQLERHRYISFHAHMGRDPLPSLAY